MKNKRSIEIKCPIEDVFWTMHEKAPQWSHLVVERQIIGEDQQGVGTQFRTVVADRGKRTEYRGVITAFDPPYAVAVRLIGQFFEVEAAYAFESLGDRTQLTQLSIITGKGFTRLFFRLFGWLIEKGYDAVQDRELNSLKQFCESQPRSSQAP